MRLAALEEADIAAEVVEVGTTAVLLSPRGRWASPECTGCTIRKAVFLLQTREDSSNRKLLLCVQLDCWRLDMIVSRGDS